MEKVVLKWRKTTTLPSVELTAGGKLMEDIKQIIAKNISALRAESGMTQLELADKLHYSDKAVSKWERGESVPEISTLILIAKEFGVTLDYLVTKEHDRIESPTEIDSESAARAEEAERRKRRNRGVIIAVACFSVWCVAVLAFVLLDIFVHGWHFAWLMFIYAIPVSAIVWLVLNSVWFSRRLNYFIITLLMWGAIVSVYLTLISFSMNIWQLFLLGIPGQVVIIICSFIKPSDKKTKKELTNSTVLRT